MMPAAKHGDPQLGLDIHLYTTPTGPVPLPAMHIALVFDPFDYVPIIGSTVKVCGMHRAIAGTGGLAIHIPFGFPFAPMLPEHDDEIFMGSSTVVTDGEPMSFSCVPVLSCQVTGMPSPPRAKRKKTAKPRNLPLTINLAIPTNVLVGGLPTISLAALAFKAAFKGLGKLRKSKLAKHFADRFKKLRQKVFKNMDSGFLKCKVLRAEPVNILTGDVVIEQTDFTLPGLIPVEWVRQYNSGNRRKGACGYGWECPADIRLEFDSEDGSLTFLHPGEGPALFPELPAQPGDAGAVLELMDGALLSDHGHELQVRTKTGLIYHFAKDSRIAGAAHIQEIPLSRISDLCGNWLDFERRGRLLVAIQESAGRRVVLRHENGLIRGVSLHLPHSSATHRFVEYDYDGEDDLIAVRDQLYNPYTFAYDRHRIVRHTNRNGLSFHYEYDKSEEHWKVVHAWGDGKLYDYRFVYLPAVRERRITDSLGYVSTIQCNEWDLPILEINPFGERILFEYDEAGRTTAIVDAANHRTEYRYDERGNLLGLTRPDGTAAEVTFDTNSKPTSILDPNGNTWRQNWDARGLLIEQRSPLGAVTKYQYNPSGLLTDVIEADGAETRFGFDNYGYLVSRTDALGNVSRWRRDELGNTLAVTDPLGRTTTYRYDAKSQLIEAILPTGTKIRCAYDAQGLLTHYTDENGAETRFEYVGLGMQSKRYQPNGTVFQYQYDTEERLIGLINQRGETYRLQRDALGRVVREVDYWGQATAYQFDSAGYLKQSRDPLGRAVDYTNDAMGRVRRKSFAHPDFPDSPDRRFVETFEFDSIGNLIRCANEHVTVKRTYDADSRLVEEQQNKFSVKNTLDVLGRRIRRETADHVVVYEYDALGRVSSIRIDDQAPIFFERDAAGQVLKERLSEDLERSYRYDAAGRLTAQGVKNETDWLFHTDYEYDAAGNLIQRHDSNTGIDRYKYDPVAQVFEHIDPQARVERFLQDPAGDRLVTRAQSSSESNPIHWSREGEFGGVFYRFNAAGNLVERRDEGHRQRDESDLKITTLIWDANQRLVGSRTGPAGAAEPAPETMYGYDPLGRRVFKRTGDRCTWFGWDGDALLAEGPAETPRSPAWQPRREFVYYPNTWAPLALVDQSGSYLYHNDPNGCPTRLTSPHGSVVWAAKYELWGRAKILVDQIENPLRLLGQYADPETGLHYNRNRYYDPNAGQFISQDPIGLLGGENLYAYAPNPLVWVDPLGWTGNPANATHITYEGVKDGKPYIGYASKPGLGHSREDVLAYRYPNTDHFDVAPQVIYRGEGQEGKNVARGLEQRIFEQRGGLEGTSNKQNPVGPLNPNRANYLAAADAHLASQADQAARGATGGCG